MEVEFVKTQGYVKKEYPKFREGCVYPHLITPK